MRERNVRLDGLRQFGEKAHSVFRSVSSVHPTSVPSVLNLFPGFTTSTTLVSVTAHTPEHHQDTALPSRYRRAVSLVSIFRFPAETSTKQCSREFPCTEMPLSAGLSRKLPRRRRKASFRTIGDHSASWTR